jgi:hypothetical protein
MKKDRVADLFLEQIRKIPIVQVACEKVGLNRNTVYRWRADDPEFAKAMDAALAEGEALINDMGESQLLTLMKEKNWHAISFWLRKRNPKFRDKVEVTARIERDEALTPEQEEMVRRALGLAALVEEPKEISNEIKSVNDTNHDTTTVASKPAVQEPSPAAGIGGGDAQGPQSQSGDHKA